jgi:hypothetical protein
MRSGATIAVVMTRLRRELPVTALAAAACGLLAYLQRYDDAQARLAGCIVFATLSGIACALLLRGTGRYRDLDLCEQSAPLYGRELARATALVPCVVVSTGIAAFWIVSSFYAAAQVGQIAVCAFCSYAASFAALCATVRKGLARALYVTLACAISAAAFGLVQSSAAAALIFCAAAGFIALRQYGEALARYDPI